MDIKKELEIEYKSLLENETQFLKLQDYFCELAEGKESYTQTNFYFDSEEMDALKHKLTLRIREKRGTWELTVKMNAKKTEAKHASYSAKEEWNLALSFKEAFAILQGKALTKEHPLIQDVIARTGMNEAVAFHCIGSLQTTRTDYFVGEDVVSLDKSEYNGITDYEIEWETEKQHEKVQQIFKELNLISGNAKGKRGRFVQSLQREVS